jgi:hypothetical protein
MEAIEALKQPIKTQSPPQNASASVCGGGHKPSRFEQGQPA